MATTKEEAGRLAKQLVREQCYLLMMRPADPEHKPARTQDEIRLEHHDYLVDLERRGLLVGAGPCRDGDGWVRGTGMIIVRAADRAEAEALGAAEPFTAAGLRSMDIIPWQRNEGNMVVNLRLADGVLEIDNRRWSLGAAD